MASDVSAAERRIARVEKQVATPTSIDWKTGKNFYRRDGTLKACVYTQITVTGQIAQRDAVMIGRFMQRVLQIADNGDDDDDEYPQRAVEYHS